jgi:hypothetical protein
MLLNQLTTLPIIFDIGLLLPLGCIVVVSNTVVLTVAVLVGPGEIDVDGVVEIELVIAPGEIELVTGHTMAMAGHTVPDWQTGTQ